MHRGELGLPAGEDALVTRSPLPMLLVRTDLDDDRVGALAATVDAVVHANLRDLLVAPEVEFQPRTRLFHSVKEVVGMLGTLLGRRRAAGLEFRARAPRLSGEQFRARFECFFHEGRADDHAQREQPEQGYAPSALQVNRVQNRRTFGERRQQRVRELTKLGQRRLLLGRRQIGEVHERARAQRVPEALGTLLTRGSRDQQRFIQRVPNALSLWLELRLALRLQRAQRPIARLPIGLTRAALGVHLSRFSGREHVLREVCAGPRALREHGRAFAQFRVLATRLGQRWAAPKPIDNPPVSGPLCCRRSGFLLAQFRFADSHGRDASRLLAKGQSELALAVSVQLWPRSAPRSQAQGRMRTRARCRKVTLSAR